MNGDDEISILLRESAEGWLEANHDTDSLRGELTLRPTDRARWAAMAEMGWLGLMLPEDLGGSGLGVSEACVLAEVFGRGLLPEPFVASVVMPSVVVAAAGGGALGDALAGDLVAGDRVLAVAWQAAPGDLDGAPGVVFDGGTVSGVSDPVVGVDTAGLLLVRARAAGGETVVVAVSAETAGVTLHTVPAGAGGSLTKVTFEGAAIEGDGPLLSGAAADAAVAAAVDAGRTVVAAQMAGLAAGARDKTVAYVADRKQFGRTLGSFQTVQHRLVDIHIGVMMTRACAFSAARACAAGTADRAMEAAAAKARAGDVAIEAGRLAIQLYGAMGFTEEVDIGLYLRHAFHLSSWLGSPVQVRRRFLAEWRSRGE
jgi:alkylation response protein AidB-like acyl-CoA dehydrogenase